MKNYSNTANFTKLIEQLSFTAKILNLIRNEGSVMSDEDRLKIQTALNVIDSRSKEMNNKSNIEKLN